MGASLFAQEYEEIMALVLETVYYYRHYPFYVVWCLWFASHVLLVYMHKQCVFDMKGVHCSSREQTSTRFIA